MCCFDPVLQEVSPNKLFTNLAPIGIAEHSVTYQRRIPPYVFRGVFTDNFL